MGVSCAEVAISTRTTYLLRQSYSAVYERLKALTGTHGLAPGEYKMLSVIAASESCSSADLARTNEVTPQAVNQLVTGLERRKMIRRFAHEENRRVVLVALTEQGRAAVAACDEAAEALDAALFGALAPTELEVFRAVLVKTAQLARGPLPVARTDQTPSEVRSKRPASNKRPGHKRAAGRAGGKQ